MTASDLCHKHSKRRKPGSIYVIFREIFGFLSSSLTARAEEIEGALILFLQVLIPENLSAG